MASVFISYSSQDLELARKFVKWFEEKGHQAWMDKKKILAGASYREKIADGIAAADIFIPILSPNSVHSKWVKRELYYADGKNKFIIPVLTQFTKIPEELQFALAGIHYVDFSSAENEYDPWRELEKALEENRKTQPSEGREDVDIPSSRPLQDYISRKARQKVKIKMGTLVSVLIGFLCLGIVLDQYVITPRLPDPQSIKVQGVTPETQNAIRLVYSTPLEQDTPSAAATVLIQKGPDMTSPWRPLLGGEELSSNDNYAVIFQPEETAFFYVFQIDSAGKLDWLFPANPSTSHSEGNNPVSKGQWIRLPDQQDEAYYLDENLGIEHLYIVASSTRWKALEDALGRAKKSDSANKTILASFSLKTRGSAGKRKVEVNLPSNINIKSENVKQVMKGKAGVLVVEKWFRHVKSTD